MGQAHDFDVLYLDDDEAAVVEVVGEIDLSVAQHLVEALGRAADRRRLAIDLAQTTFIDSAGVQALVMVWRARDSAGLDTMLRNPSPAVSRILKLTGLGPVLAVEHTTRADEPDRAR